MNKQSLQIKETLKTLFKKIFNYECGKRTAMVLETQSIADKNKQLSNL